MEISNGKVKIFGDLEIERVTNGENNTETLRFDSESPQFFDRSIDDTLNKLKDIVNGVG